MDYSVRNPYDIAILGLASFPFARRYSGNRFFFLFLRLLRCFSSAGVPTIHYVFMYCWLCMTTAGFPHSDISGSIDICSSPELFAACHVLLRHLMPRHSPCALNSLTCFFPIENFVRKCFCTSVVFFQHYRLPWLFLEKTFFNIVLSCHRSFANNLN